MDIFALRPNSTKHFFITEARYFEETQRRPPWATHTKSTPKMPLYLATCPECKNAIEIRELDRVRGENDRAPMQPFGKHYKYDVPALEIVYNQDAYDKCSLRAKVSLSTAEPRANQAFNIDILKMIVEQAVVIREVMAARMGISVGPTLFEGMIRKFVKESRYKCKGVIPSNLPFSIIYWCESQGLIGQMVSPKETELQDAIKKSKHFCLNGQQIISNHWHAKLQAAEKVNQKPPAKPEWGAHKIAFFMGRRVHRGDEKNGEPNHMTLTVTEHTNDKPEGTPIFTKKITYSNLHFANAINSFNQRLEDPKSADEARKKQIETGMIAYKYIAGLLPSDWRPLWANDTALS